MTKQLTTSAILLILAHPGTGATAHASEEARPDGAGAAATAAPADETPATVPVDGEETETVVDEGGGPGLFEQSQAGGDSAGEASAGTQPPPSFSLNGYTRGDVYVGKVPGAKQGDTKAAYGELSLTLRTAKQSYGDGYAEVRIRHGFQGGDDPVQTSVMVREAYVNAYLGPVDLRLGKQIIVWGRADMLNPTNNLTPADFRARSPIEDDRRLGNMGARVTAHLSPVRLEGVWLPAYSATTLPTLSLPKYVSFGDPTYPSPKLQEGLGALRAHLELSAIELSVSYLNGYAPLPGLTLANLLIQPDDPKLGQRPSVLLSRTAYRHQVVGGDFSTALGTWLALRGEVAYRRPYDYQNRAYAPHPDLQYALGADRTFGSLNVIVQYLGRYTFDWEKKTGTRSGPDTEILDIPYNDNAYTIASGLAEQEIAKTNQVLFSQTARVQHLATARLEWRLWHDTLSLSVLGFRNFTTREWLLAPKMGYHISDSLIAYVGAEIFYGPAGTLFGMIDQSMSAGYAELRATF